MPVDDQDFQRLVQTVQQLTAQLNDLQQQVTAQSNELQQQVTPIGTIVAFGGPRNLVPPTGWILCDGRAISRVDYDPLFKIISTYWGYGDGQTTFNLPDLCGQFLRGVDSTSDGLWKGRDPQMDPANFQRIPGGNVGNDQVGTRQLDSIQSHTHIDQGHSHAIYFGTTKPNGGAIVGPQGDRANPTHGDAPVEGGRANLGPPETEGNRAVLVSAETRPTNACVYYIIRAA